MFCWIYLIKIDAYSVIEYLVFLFATVRIIKIAIHFSTCEKEFSTILIQIIEHNLRPVKVVEMFTLKNANIVQSIVKFSDQLLIPTSSYDDPPKLYKWICVGRPLSQIRSHLIQHL